MKRRLLSVFSKKFNYMFDNVKIISDVELNKEQVKDICDIVRETLRIGYYEKGFTIARKVVYRLGKPVCYAECRFGRKKVYIKISQYHRSRAFK